MKQRWCPFTCPGPGSILTVHPFWRNWGNSPGKLKLNENIFQDEGNERSKKQWWAITLGSSVSLFPCLLHFHCRHTKPVCYNLSLDCFFGHLLALFYVFTILPSFWPDSSFPKGTRSYHLPHTPKILKQYLIVLRLKNWIFAMVCEDVAWYDSVLLSSCVMYHFCLLSQWGFSALWSCSWNILLSLLHLVELIHTSWGQSL